MSRPALLPKGSAARIALGCLLAFALFRALLFGITTPPFWGPDEDYHFLYADYIATQGALISPDRPLYTREFLTVDEVVDYGSYCCRKGGRFEGDPKASLRELAPLAEGRAPTEIGRGVGVVHPPLYQLTGAALTKLMGNASILTRATWLRFVSALFGVLAVYFAWLLAAQVFSNERLQLLAAFIVAAQPLLGFMSGVVNHDAALVAFSTASLAMMAYILRTVPQRWQGTWLGAALVLALLVKGSALALLPLGALALVGQALVYPGARREVLRSAGMAALVIALLAAPWYVRAALVYESATGATTSIIGRGSPPEPVSVSSIARWTKEWTGITYRTLFWHYDVRQTPPASASKFIPAFLGLLGMLGLTLFGWRERRSLLTVNRPQMRQAVLLALAILAFYVPFLGVDLLRRAEGQPFFVSAGRYLLPAFAGAAVLLVLGLGQLVRREAEALVLWGTAAAALVFWVFVYGKYHVEQNIGLEAPTEVFRRMTFDRAPLVSSGFVAVLFALTCASLAGLLAAAVRTGRPAVGHSHYSEAR